MALADPGRTCCRAGRFRPGTTSSATQNGADADDRLAVRDNGLTGDREKKKSHIDLFALLPAGAAISGRCMCEGKLLNLYRVPQDWQYACT